jgi:hypothetical protein
MNNETYIMGYSLDSVIEAVRRKINGENVHFLATAKLGEPLDTYRDMVNAATVDMLKAITPIDLNFEKYHNPRHLYIPYDKVSITNTKNGVIAFPLNKNSFESEEEWKAVMDAFTSEPIQKLYQDKGNTPSKLITAMKNSMPKKFVDTFCKALSTTRWRGINVSKLTMIGYSYEYSFALLGTEYVETFYKPKCTYEQMCNDMLEAAGIEITPVTAKVCKKIIMDKEFTETLVVMDNRIDSYMDYICGMFDRVRMVVSPVKIPSAITSFGDGIFYTPLVDEFWGVNVIGSMAYKLSAVHLNTIYNDFISELPLTRTNAKLYNTYAGMIKFYGKNKTLDINQRVVTMIK